ncbi:MAG: thioredoxin family protein [Gammaproteobacteria bacterium]|nr:thioredoxin family protein [Gammaproteobacteria bacterium]
MNHTFLKISLLIMMFSSTVVIAGAELYEQQPSYSKGYNPKSNPFDDGRNALKLAKETNRRVLIEVGGDWCMYCHVLDRFIKSNPEIEKRLYETFVVLKVNYSDENRNREFLSSFGRIPGYPHLFITESSGKVVYSNDIRDMSDSGRLSKIKMLRFLNQWNIKNNNKL